MQKIPSKKAKNPYNAHFGARIYLESAYSAAFRPIHLAHYLTKLRRGKESPKEISELKKIVGLALKLHLPFPNHFSGDPVSLKRLAIAKAEASLCTISPILEAVRKRLRIPKPKEKEIPAWMIRSYQQEKEIRIQRTKENQL